jgi:thymidine kinase
MGGAPAPPNPLLLAGTPARYDSPQVMVGGAEAYEARCRNCHKILPAEESGTLKLF